jgi:hypothetical protein
MELLVGVLAGAILTFIVIKFIEMNKKSDSTTSNTTGGGGAGYSSTNPDISGEVPKDRIK